MPPKSKRWDVYPRAPEAHLNQFPHVPRLVVQILYNRGITEAQEIEQFLHCYWADADPLGFKGMREAVERICRAIANQEPIAIYGDYDVDGVTATALMVQFLWLAGANVQPYIPNRFDEGYGLNNEALTELHNRGVGLVVTVDCGIRSVAEVAHGRTLGLDLIITDHHSPGTEIPAALAVINPKQADCGYPFKELAGVGLAYKLACALNQTDLLRPRQIQVEQFLDLVALGTVADLAPLHGENRSLVAQGLRLLNQSLRPGLQALLRVCGNHAKRVTAGMIGFVVGPRLNAAGRLDSAIAAYNLLMAHTEFEAIHVAQQLDLQNRERQRITQEAVEIARQAIVVDDAQSPLYFIRHTEFNRGIVGLAASRLVEEFYRPCLVAEQGPEETKGSARSIAEFHITEALDACADLLKHHGGHAAAAGFTLDNENVPKLEARVLELARTQLNVAELRPTIAVDGEINLRGVRPKLVDSIDMLQPFGISNPTPRFVSRNLFVRQAKPVGQDKKHLKLTLNDGKYDWGAIAFRQAQWAAHLQNGQQVDVVYQLEFNEWQGNKRVQLNIKDIALA